MDRIVKWPRATAVPTSSGIWLRSPVKFLPGLALMFWLSPAHAASTPADICDAAAHTASAETGVPVSVLRAISLTETGRKKSGEFKPWPWTVNMEGKGVWFDSEDEARAYVYKNYKRGARSFDVGCFQLNYRWHGQAFASIDQMFEPRANAVYAANFLSELFQEFGNWTDAAGAYHSRTPEFANKYKKRFTSIRSKLTDQVDPEIQLAEAEPEPTEKPMPDRINRFPLLVSLNTANSNMGSLVPSSAGIGLPRLIAVGN